VDKEQGIRHAYQCSSAWCRMSRDPRRPPFSQRLKSATARYASFPRDFESPQTPLAKWLGPVEKKFESALRCCNVVVVCGVHRSERRMGVRNAGPKPHQGSGNWFTNWPCRGKCQVIWPPGLVVEGNSEAMGSTVATRLNNSCLGLFNPRYNQ
jgi:hypothetical protein